MQAYGPGFARIYNMKFGDFARAVAPRIRAYYESTNVGQTGNRTLVDICCGTAVLDVHFLGNGYQAIGVDLSHAMLEYARVNTASYVEARQIRFFETDATQFGVERPVGLAVSTYESMNHLPDMATLGACFQHAYQAVVSGGSFIFDLNTRLGLRRWAGMTVQESDELMMITSGIHDESQNRAFNRIFGFLRLETGAYERFEEVITNTAFGLTSVRNALHQSGWQSVRFCRITDLNTPLEEPEKESRVWVVAMKS
jgi:SAM-dependent methyltransferase